MKNALIVILLLLLAAATVSAQLTITTIAGTGAPGFSGDGGSALGAQINYPQGLAIDGAGNLYFADFGNMRVRKISPAGIITTVAGNGIGDFTGESGRATSESLWFPARVAVDSVGNLYISDRDNSRVRKVSPSGMMTTVAGGGDCCGLGDGGQATRAVLRSPSGLAIGPTGNLFIADYGHHRIRRVDSRGQIETFAGFGGFGTATNGPLARNAEFGYPQGMALDSAGNLYVASGGGSSVVRRMTPSGMITTVAGGGTESFSTYGAPATSVRLNVSDMAVDEGGWLYLSEYERIFLVSPGGLIYLLTGGLNVSAIAVDKAGSIYLSEPALHRIRKITR